MQRQIEKGGDRFVDSVGVDVDGMDELAGRHFDAYLSNNPTREITTSVWPTSSMP